MLDFIKKNCWSIGFVAALVAGILRYTFTYSSHPDEYRLAFENSFLIEQPDQITCGPTSGAMALRLFGKNTSVDTIAKDCKTRWFKYGRKDIGMTAPDYLSLAIKKQGVSSKLRVGTIDQIKHFISDNQAVVVLLRSGPTTWHYVLVVGYTKTHLEIADPARGELRLVEEKVFLDAWSFIADTHGDKCGICPLCKGSGKTCTLCAGSGMFDYLKNWLSLSGIEPCTYIVIGHSIGISK